MNLVLENFFELVLFKCHPEHELIGGFERIRVIQRIVWWVVQRTARVIFRTDWLLGIHDFVCMLIKLHVPPFHLLLCVHVYMFVRVCVRMRGRARDRARERLAERDTEREREMTVCISCTSLGTLMFVLNTLAKVTVQIRTNELKCIAIGKRVRPHAHTYVNAIHIPRFALRYSLRAQPQC